MPDSLLPFSCLLTVFALLHCASSLQNVGVAKTVLSELSDDTNAPRAFSFIGVATGFGRLVGPAIGGLLAQPAVKYLGTFAADGLFGRHPFLLPCLVCGIITAVCFTLGAVFLEETGPQRRKKAGSTAAGSASSSAKEPTAAAETATGDVEAAAAEADSSSADGGMELVAAQLDSRAERAPSGASGKEIGRAQSHRGRRARGGSAAVKLDDAAPESLGSAAVPEGATAVELASPSGTPSGIASTSAHSADTARSAAAAGVITGASGALVVAKPAGTGSKGTAAAAAESPVSLAVSKPARATGNDAASSAGSGSGHDAVAFAGAAADADDSDSEKPSLLGDEASARQRGCCGMRCGYWYTLRRLLADRAVASTVAVYAGLSVIGLVATEVFPLYVLNDAEHGGFSWGPSDVGLLVSICGPFLLLWNLLVYHRLVKRLGLVRMARLCIATNAVLMVATPFCSLALKARPPPAPEQLIEIAQADAAAAAAAAAGDGAAAAAAASAANAAVTKTALEWIVLGIVFIGSTLSRVSAFTCIFVFIANSALPADRSSANAIGQAVASVARAVGPPVATSVFASSVSDANTAAGWPWNYHLSWYMIGATTFGVLGLTYAMPSWIAKKREAAASEPASAEGIKPAKPSDGLKEER